MSIAQTVVRAMERIAPLSLAESWDNVGLLLEAAKPRTAPHILLTIDLTPQVLTHALALPTPPSLILTYHPPIFAPLKSLTLAPPLQRTLLTLAREGISVFCPHTALDSAEEGVNWWIAKGLVGPGTGDARYERWERCGGVVRMDRPTELAEIVRRVKAHFGITSVNVAAPEPGRLISSIALCAGSGGSVLEVNGKDVDCWLTGEMPHHEVLAAVGSGKTVLLCGHTNTERGYLPTLREKLLAELRKEKALDWSVQVSEADAHPLQLC